MREMFQFNFMLFLSTSVAVRSCASLVRRERLCVRHGSDRWRPETCAEEEGEKMP